VLSRTAFDASLHCTEVDRVACLNWDKVYAAVLRERPGFDAVAVVLNTDRYIGSASSSGIVVSRHDDGPRVTLHEMGHLVAGLADEYVDANVADGLLPYYKEGRFPNVTTTAEPGQIPWRHWFVDPEHIPMDSSESGVGRFEGAYYTQSGFYRPTRDSFMRTVGAPIGPVNAEAWLRAQYRAVPPLGAVHPNRRVVTGYAGDALEFEIASPWPAGLMTVRWFVDEIEIESAKDTWHYQFEADGHAHRLRVSIDDRTALIRAPEAHEHTGGFTWTISTNPSGVSSKASTPTDEIGGWIRMRVGSAGHEVMGITTHESVSAPRLGAVADGQFEYALFDAAGTLLSQRQIADPRIVRAPMALPGASVPGHQIVVLEDGYYLIEVPAGADARRLRIRTVQGSPETASQYKIAATPIEQWLDL
jgi:hypothetical protein